MGQRSVRQDAESIGVLVVDDDGAIRARSDARLHLSVDGRRRDARHMPRRTSSLRLTTVQIEIEALLAQRPVGDLSPPPGYRSLVSLEAALLERLKVERSG